MSLFASSSSAFKPSGNTFGSFGSSTNQQQPASTGTGLFGSFGGSTNQQQQPQNAQPSGGSLFGGQQQQNNPNPLFGGGNVNQPAPALGGSLFGGGNAQQQQQQQPATGTSLFGGGAGGTTGGNLFGGAQPAGGTGTTTGGTLFGASGSNAPQNPAPTGSLFGMTASGTTSPTGSLFGGQNQQAGATNQPSLFGSFGQNAQNQNQQQQPQPTGLFGQSQQQQPQQQQPSSLFGSTINTSAGSGLFGGGLSNTQLGGSTLGASKLSTSALGGPSAGGSMFGSRSTAGVSPTQQQGDGAQAQFQTLVQRIEGIAQAWDSSSPQSRFQHYFYNLVEPSQLQRYVRPQNATNEALWQKAVRENPDPSCYVPALAVGFDDLQQRVEAQRQLSTAHQEKIKELKTRISALSDAHSLTNTPRLSRAISAQTQLVQRLTRLCQHLHLLIPSVRSSAIRPEEEALRDALESLEDEVRKPGVAGRLKGKLNELWAMIGALEAAREKDGKGGDGNVEWAVVDPEGLQRIAHILAEQQAGMAHLTKIVQGQVSDLDVILGKSSREKETDAFSSSQAHQALLASTNRGT
ncbi:hypothetical protein BD410DRAFT_760973 [Rickenella mellea]|uniref:Nucleoporin Nup54 alpha-helical domain-containing protein n=1 Tax=Rickenella mellea TaxID=50990 RepID=A0A4Y7QKQ8_9AGAM|nr:hypothetical protein BD410DRAFT_760973 [Rickenella mellea]